MKDVLGFENIPITTSIPDRKPCSDEVLEWIDGYLENSKEVSYDEHYINLINQLAETRHMHLYRGAYGEFIPTIGSIVDFKYINSWSTDKKVALDYAREEQYNICHVKHSNQFPFLYEVEDYVNCFTPTEYCSEDTYKRFEHEKEVSTVSFKAKVKSIEVIQSDENYVPIYYIKLEIIK